VSFLPRRDTEGWEWLIVDRRKETSARLKRLRTEREEQRFRDSKDPHRNGGKIDITLVLIRSRLRCIIKGGPGVL
jgi:hypothetical protein